MKTTVLKACKQTADMVAKDLLSRTSPAGKPIFRKVEITDGFEIRARYKGNEVVVFRYTNDNGRERFDYEERLLTF